MNMERKTGRFGAGLLALSLVGILAAGPQVARADDPPPKDKGAGKQAKKQDSIPIKIVPPIIVPDKGKDAKGADKQGK